MRVSGQVNKTKKKSINTQARTHTHTHTHASLQLLICEVNEKETIAVSRLFRAVTQHKLEKAD